MPLKLLVIDDEKLFVRAVSGFLSRHCGYTVETACNGLQAVQRIEEGQPALAIMDLKLPDVSAEEVIRQLHQRSPQTKVIIVTAYRDEPTQERFLQKPGVVGYLFKPPSLLELKQRIAAALGHSP